MSESAVVEKLARWIPAREALELVSNRMVAYPGEADVVIASSAREGLICSRARRFIRSLHGKPQVTEDNVELPSGFWWSGAAAEFEANWEIGSFSTWIKPSEQWRAHGVEFAADGIISIAPPPAVVSDAPPLDNASLSEGRTAPRAGGRRPAHWWADFAEELAVYLHENGLPMGIGAEGQSEIFDAVSNRLATAGKNTPDRSTVQPVISAVLRRIRSAEN